MAEIYSFKVDGVEIIPVGKGKTIEGQMAYLRAQEVAQEIIRAERLIEELAPPAPVTMKAEYGGSRTHTTTVGLDG